MAASGYRWDYIEAEHKAPPSAPKRPLIPSQNPSPVRRAVDRQAVLGSVRAARRAAGRYLASFSCFFSRLFFSWGESEPTTAHGYA